MQKNVYASKGKRNIKCERSLSHVHTGLCIQNQVEETGGGVQSMGQQKLRNPCETVSKGKLSV